MNVYRADLHTHTVLSPCGDIEMTPSFIVEGAKDRGLDIVGITDHNSTLQCTEICRIADREKKPFILCGAEITSKEEVHCLAFVDGEEKLALLQRYLSEHLPKIENDTDVFGYQLVVNEQEEVISEEEYLLISAISQNISQIESFVHSLDGIFIPAHIDKMQNSVISQLGFLPPDLKVDSLEVSKRCKTDDFILKNRYLKSYNFIRSSDAHFQEDFGSGYTNFHINTLSFDEIKMALRKENGRFTEIGYE